jgi:hypothetical protein
MENNGGTLQWRMGQAERRLSELDRLEPAVMKQEIHNLKEDMHDIGKDIAALKKMFIGFIISFSIASITIVVLILQSLGK